MTEDQDKDVCKRATEIALEIARDECGGKDAMMQEMGKQLGLDPEDIPNPEGDCEEALEDGLTEERCKDFSLLRQWVLCRAWQLLENDKVDTFGGAMEQAWDEAKSQCGAKGVDV